jgi:hypothetical protein
MHTSLVVVPRLSALSVGMMDVKVAPAARGGKTLGILDGHIGPIESAGKVAPA